MGIFEWVFVIMSITAILSSIGFFVLLMIFKKRIWGFFKMKLSRENFVIQILFLKNMQKLTSYSLIEQDGCITVMGKRYEVMPECLVYQKSIPFIYHYEDNPHPLDFRKRTSDIEINSENFDLLKRSKLLKDWLLENKLLLFILIISAVNTLIGIAIALKVFGILDKVAKKGG
jgi:NADH:ubiquinone oxidoreductase subunit K